MSKNVSLDEFNSIVGLLQFLKSLNLLDPVDYMVTWEKKPQLIINKLGNFEFENPEEVYGCMITFWNDEGLAVSKQRYYIKDK
jgi:hypothetical protein